MDDDFTSISGHNIAYQRREWTVQRVGWVGMGLFVLAAFIGLLGSGPLAETQAEAANGSLRLGYQRVARHHQPRALTVTVSPEFVQDGKVQIWLDRAYSHEVEMRSIVPEPESIEVEPDRIIYVFDVRDASGPLAIRYFYESGGYWRESGTIGIVDGPAISFWQLVLP